MAGSIGVVNWAVAFRDCDGFGVEAEVDMRLLHKDYAGMHNRAVACTDVHKALDVDYLRYRQCGFLSLALRSGDFHHRRLVFFGRHSDHFAPSHLTV